MPLRQTWKERVAAYGIGVGNIRVGGVLTGLDNTVYEAETTALIEALRAAGESAELKGTKSRQIIELLRKENMELKSSIAHFKTCYKLL